MEQFKDNFFDQSMAEPVLKTIKTKLFLTHQISTIPRHTKHKSIAMGFYEYYDNRKKHIGPRHSSTAHKYRLMQSF